MISQFQNGHKNICLGWMDVKIPILIMLKEFVDKTLNNFDLFQSRLKKSDML